MRDIEELKKVLLDNFYVYFKFGLCEFFNDLWVMEFITNEEYEFLIKKLKEHRNYKENGYVWKINEIEPRIKWIKNL